MRVAQSCLAATLGLGLVAGTAGAQVPEGAALGTQEDHPTITLPEPPPHWVYILEPVFPYLVSSKVWILDGDTLEFVGMASAGYTANLVLSHDKSAFYIAETYWDRGTRGNRADVVTTYDAQTLDVTGEVLLPEGRFLVVPKKYNAQLTTDGRYLLSFNMDPAFGISVVDVQEQKYIGEIETGGCSLAFPTGPASFASPVPRRLVRPCDVRRQRRGARRRAASRSSIPRTTRCSSTPPCTGRTARPSSSPMRAGSIR